MPAPPNIESQLLEAEHAVRDLSDTTIDIITLKPLGKRYTAFLAKNVSKLSPLVASIIEARTVEMLNARETGPWDWRRQDPAFPDAGLFGTNGTPTGTGFEIKAWHALSTEITGRFKESRARLVNTGIRIVLVAWVLDNILWGTPHVLGVEVVDAQSVAEARDRHYYRPPEYLVKEPEDTADRTKNLAEAEAKGDTATSMAMKGAKVEQLLRGPR